MCLNSQKKVLPGPIGPRAQAGTESPDFDRLTEVREILHEAGQDRAEIVRLRAELAAERKVKLEANRTWRILNGMDIDEWDNRAEMLMQTLFDGLSIGPTNRLLVKATLADHFADIASRRDAELAAARRDAERLMEALELL